MMEPPGSYCAYACMYITMCLIKIFSLATDTFQEQYRYVRVCECVCMCVCERERVCERECVCVCVLLTLSRSVVVSVRKSLTWSAH
jgi:hypothetical protein